MTPLARPWSSRIASAIGKEGARENRTRKSPSKPIAGLIIRRTPTKSTISPAGIWLSMDPIDREEIKNPI